MDTPQPVHLLVLMHGMWGNPSHLAEASRIIREKAEARDTPEQIEFEVLVAQANQHGSTYDGIDWGGERIADEICEHVEELEKDSKKKITKFSVLGYSLGGLLGRYVIGILQSRKFFSSITPTNFTTIATPHIGLPRYPSLWSSLTNALGPRLLSRTGEQFYAVDIWADTGKSLLEVMASPETIFLEALKRFERVVLYANAVNDLTVPYVTASINEEDPFADHEARGLKVEFLESYKPVLSSYTIPSTPPPKAKSPRLFSKAWLQNVKDMKPPLPPFLQKPFPLNIALYAAIPVLLPTFICLALIRLSLDSRASRARIKLLEAEAEAAEASGEGAEGSGARGRLRLIHLLRTIEKEVDDAVAEFVDDPGRPGRGLLRGDEEGDMGSRMGSRMGSGKGTPEPESRLEPRSGLEPGTPSSAETIAETPNSGEGSGEEQDKAEDKPLKSTKRSSSSSSKSSKSPKPSKNTPLLKPSQLLMVRSLNISLPNMQKYAAYIHPIRNAHGTIISRDVRNFDFHKLGEGVLVHWADGFVF